MWGPYGDDVGSMNALVRGDELALWLTNWSLAENSDGGGRWRCDIDEPPRALLLLPPYGCTECASVCIAP